MDKIDLILHPIRARIISTAAHAPITTQAIAARMPDIPQTTLYRHINLLIENNVLTIVREVKVRGTVERELRLVDGAGRISLDALAALSRDEQLHYFLVFAAMLISDFSRAADEVSALPIALYSKDHIYATPEEMAHIREQIDTLITPYHQPRSADPIQRCRWSLTGIIMTDPDKDASTPSEETSE